MPRPKKQPDKNLAEHLSNYDNKTLLGALNSFENNLGWDVFKSFVYYQAAVHGTMSNVLVQQSNRQSEACAAGAKAEVLREVVDQFMTSLKQKLEGYDGIIENPMPEEQHEENKQ